MTWKPEGRSKPRAARKIRVVHVVPSTFGFSFSGCLHYIYSLLAGWKDEGITLDLWGTSVRPLNIGSGDPDYRLETQLWAPGKARRNRLGRLMEYARQLAFLAVHARSFDVAHFHHLGWETFISPMLLHLLGKKAVFTTSLLGSDNPTAVMGTRGGSWAVSLMGRFDGIVAVSPALERDWLEFGHKNVLCLPCFLTLRQLDRGRDVAAREKLRRELAIPADATVLLFVGAVIRRKGVDLLAESFVRLASRNRDLWLIIVGPNSRGEASNYEEVFARGIRERIERAGAAPRVVWTGTVSNKDAFARYYSAADVFVFPTRAEGLGNVLIEASAAELPVVATNLVGVTDTVVVDGETGFLVPPEDIDALTQAIERLVSDPALRAKMGQAARAYSKRFGFEDYCRRLRDFYVKVAGLPAD